MYPVTGKLGREVDKKYLCFSIISTFSWKNKLILLLIRAVLKQKAESRKRKAERKKREEESVYDLSESEWVKNPYRFCIGCLNH